MDARDAAKQNLLALLKLRALIGEAVGIAAGLEISALQLSCYVETQHDLTTGRMIRRAWPSPVKH